MHRWIGNESRSHAVERLIEIYDEGFKITDDLLSKEKSLKENQNELCDTNSQVFQKYIVEFTNSLNGIDNLKKTYKNDVETHKDGGVRSCSLPTIGALLHTQ